MSEGNKDPKATLSNEEASKDQYFQRIASLAEEMVAAHGRDFSMGALVLAARWIAENKIGGGNEPDGEDG